MGQGEEDVSVRLVGENGMSMSGLDCGKPRVGLAKCHAVLTHTLMVLSKCKMSSYLVRPPILVLKARFSARACLRSIVHVGWLSACSTMCRWEHEKPLKLKDRPPMADRVKYLLSHN